MIVECFQVFEDGQFGFGAGGGRVCFRGTRVPVNALLDNREDGLSPDEFLEQFEGGVTREQALAVLEFFEVSRPRVKGITRGGLRSLDSMAGIQCFYGLINSVVLTVTTQWTSSPALPFTLIVSAS
jgi:uncharacterized protein (DUF433 family)